MGLAIAARLVDLMQGRIWVESEVGRGSSFCFTCVVPIGMETASQAPLDVSRLRDVLTLVVDDNSTNRRIMEELLAKWGMHVVTAASASAALDQARRASTAERPFQLVITDLHMPAQDGFDFVRALRKLPPGETLPVIMTTSGARRVDSQLCRQLGVARYLLKPVKQSELLEAIFFALGIESPTTGLAKEALFTDDQEGIGPLKILLAEDGIANQKLAVALLERWGHEVTVVNNGREVVQAMHNGPFDVCLMDLQMPEMDGLEATRVIRQLEQTTRHHLPIIAMTAHVMPGDRDACLAAGMDGYVSKPVRKRQLYQTLQELFGRQCATTDSGASEPAEAAPLIDWKAALQVVEGDVDVLRDIASLAVEELEQLVFQLETAVAQHHGPQIQRAAHTIQGTLRVFGNQLASAALADLEDRGRQGHLEDIDVRFAAVKPLLLQIRYELAQYLG